MVCPPRPGRPRTWTIIAAAVLVAGALTAPEAPAAEADQANPFPTLSADTFEHARHKTLACLTCHLSTSQSMLTFEPPRGCQICHHQSPSRADCSRCHEPAGLPEAVRIHVSIAAAAKPARDRPVAFRHERHTSLDCINCHGQPVTLAPVDSATTCRGCHANHHEVDRTCAGCHRTDTIRQVHVRPARVHVACDACHAAPTIALLTPTRSFCLVCHDAQVDHQPDRECATCHLQANPEEYRSRLTQRSRTG